MTKHTNPAIIGGFVVGAVFLVISGIFVFSSGNWFIEKNRFVIYFDESVNGLNIGAPVKLSGVQIGKVIEIKVRVDSESKKILTPVFIEIEPDKTEGISDFSDHLSKDEILERMIQDGLRMQLQLTSLLTGQLYIEALLRPDTPIRLTNRSKRIKELPAIHSSGTVLQETIREAISDFRQIPFKELFSDIQQAVQNIERLTGSEETINGLKALSQTLEHANRMMQTLNKQTGPLLKEIQRTVKATEATMQQVNSTFATIETAADPNSTVSLELSTALKELARAARSGRILMDYLERHPEALIQGKLPADEGS